MFTGIIRNIGQVVRCEGSALTLSLPVGLKLSVGGSVAINGTCLTATRLQGQALETDLSPETLKKTALGSLKPGDLVNLETPCRVGDSLDGHFVQGHVDTVGQTLAVQPQGDFYRFAFQVDDEWDRYLVEKGSVAVDGISLTVFDVSHGRFCVAIIPHTYQHTNLHHKKAGDPINVEFDVLGKYTEKLLNRRSQT